MNRKIPRKNKKFRFILLHNFIIANYKPCKVADIGGGKGLLSYFLNKSGFESTVIDPLDQSLPDRFNDLDFERKDLDNVNNIVPRITAEFKREMIKDFDLIVGLHAHGSNIEIIKGCKEFEKDFILVPCCLFDEPVEIKSGENWRESLFLLAEEEGLNPQRDFLKFKGKDLIIYTKNFQFKI